MTLKQLTKQLILPLTIISFGTITKWWAVLPVDAPETMMAGFPFAFVSDGWHTSLSLQIFVFELLIDFLLYFLFWFTVISLINRYLINISTSRIFTGILWTVSGMMFALAIWVASITEPIFHPKRTWDMKILKTGFKFTWTHLSIPDVLELEPNIK